MNSVNLIGRLTKENEPKQYNSQNGAGLMLKNTIALKSRKQDESYFIDFTAWGKTAEYLLKYTNKGDKIAIIGEIVQESWEDQQSGQKRSKISINVKETEILLTAQNNQAQNNQAQNNQAQNNQAQNNQESYSNYTQMPAEVQSATARHNANYNQQGIDSVGNNEIPF